MSGTTSAAANNLIAALAGAEILEEITGQSRNRRFIYRSCINLFDLEAIEDD